jgi:hypothetical protein
MTLETRAIWNGGFDLSQNIYLIESWMLRPGAAESTWPKESEFALSAGARI